MEVPSQRRGLGPFTSEKFQQAEKGLRSCSQPCWRRRGLLGGRWSWKSILCRPELQRDADRRTPPRPLGKALEQTRRCWQRRRRPAHTAHQQRKAKQPTRFLPHCPRSRPHQLRCARLPASQNGPRSHQPGPVAEVSASLTRVRRHEPDKQQSSIFATANETGKSCCCECFLVPFNPLCSYWCCDFRFAPQRQNKTC